MLMADDLNKRGAADRSRMNVTEDYELKYWSESGSYRTPPRAQSVRQLFIRISYPIELQNRGHYGVRAAARTGPRVLIAPFVTKEEAQAWIDGSDQRDAPGDLEGRSCRQQQDW